MVYFFSEEEYMKRVTQVMQHAQGLTTENIAKIVSSLSFPQKWVPCTMFHLWNRERTRLLKVSWNGVDLENTAHPKYYALDIDPQIAHVEQGIYPKQPFE